MCPYILFLSFVQELNWSLSPMTPVSWLNIYMQVAYLKTEEVLLPQYPEATFVQITEVCLHLTSPCFSGLISQHFSITKLKENSGMVGSHRCTWWKTDNRSGKGSGFEFHPVVIFGFLFSKPLCLKLYISLTSSCSFTMFNLNLLFLSFLVVGPVHIRH